MNNIQDYNPDQRENEKKYWDLCKRVYNLEEKIGKMDKPNEDGETKDEHNPDTIEGMTDKWIFDQLTTISECLKLIVDNGKSQSKVNEHTENAIKKFDETLDSINKELKVNHGEKDSFRAPLSNKVDNGNYIRVTDDFGWGVDERGGFVFSDLAGPDDGLHTIGESNDPAKTKVNVPKSTKDMGPTIVNPIGREYSYYIDGDRLEYMIHLMLRQDYHSTAIRYDDRGVNLVFSKNDNTMVTKTIHLDRI